MQKKKLAAGDPVKNRNIAAQKNGEDRKKRTMSKSSRGPDDPQGSAGSRARASALKIADTELVDAETLAGKFAVGRTTILRFAREGKIPYYAIGRAWFFSEKEVLDSLRRMGARKVA
jgi:excisionase family DNA binding protein